MCSKPPPASAAERKLWAGKGGFWRWDCLYLVIALLETESFLLSHFSCGARYKVQQESAAVGQRDIRNVNFFNYIFLQIFAHPNFSLFLCLSAPAAFSIPFFSPSREEKWRKTSKIFYFGGKEQLENDELRGRAPLFPSLCLSDVSCPSARTRSRHCRPLCVIF